jgi:hypothetical protein
VPLFEDYIAAEIGLTGVLIGSTVMFIHVDNHNRNEQKGRRFSSIYQAKIQKIQKNGRVASILQHAPFFSLMKLGQAGGSFLLCT